MGKNWKETPFKGYVYATLAINLFVGLMILIVKGWLPPLVPLFYGLPVSGSQLIPAIGLEIAPGTSLVITAINIYLSFWVKDVFLKKVLVISALTISILSAITVIKIIFLVGLF